MGANNAGQTIVGANGAVYVAPTGSTEPASISAALDPAFIELGYINEDGITFTDGKDIADINAWQSFYPIRRVVEGKDSAVSFNLMQWNINTVPLAFGGGTITEDVVGLEFRYTPPAAGTVDERALIVEWVDGTKNYRLVIPVGMVTEDVETQMQKASAGELPITFGVNGADGSDPWYLQTDDPALDPTP